MAHGFGMVAFAVLYVAHHVFALCELGVGFECAVGPGDGIDMVVALGFDVGHHGHGQRRGGVGLDGMCGAVGGTVDHVHLYQAVGLVGQGIGGVALLQQCHGFGVVFFLLEQYAQPLLGHAAGIPLGGLQHAAVVLLGKFGQAQPLGVPPFLFEAGGTEAVALHLRCRRGDGHQHGQE